MAMKILRNGDSSKLQLHSFEYMMELTDFIIKTAHFDKDK